MADTYLIRTREKQGRAFRKARLLLALLPLMAAGCAGQPTQLGTFAKTVPSEEAKLVPPPGGPGIVGVIERRFNNAVAQDIYLTTSALTPGQNAFNVQFFGTVSPFKLADNNLTSTPVTESGVASEMRQALPGIRMTRSSFFVQNNYGPFGYAFGRGAGGDLCMYGWQQVRAPSGTISPFANYGSIQVRLRLCQSDATEEQLLAVMYNYTITGAVDDGGWNPYGEPQPVADSLGGTGAPLYRRPTASEPIVPILPPRQAAVYTQPAPAVRRVENPSPRRVPVATTPATNAYPSPPAPSGPRVTVPGPGAVIPAPLTPSTTAAPPSSVTPRIPSPTGTNTASPATVPSPSCTDATSGAANACR